jgi:hypothetical protein
VVGAVFLSPALTGILWGGSVRFYTRSQLAYLPHLSIDSKVEPLQNL